MRTSRTLFVCLNVLVAMALAQNNGLVRRGIELREQDQPAKALECFREAIVKEPRNLRAYAEYVRTKAYDLERFDEVRSEYEGLMRKEPDNPVYPMALATGQFLTPPSGKRAWYESVARSAPESAWGLYAKAELTAERDPASAVASLARAVELDPALRAAWLSSIFLRERRLQDVDGALGIAGKLAGQADPELRTSGLYEVWRLKLILAKDSPEAVAALREELKRLEAIERDVDILARVRSAWSLLLKDEAGAAEAEAAIRRVDPLWYPERGSNIYFANGNESGLPNQGTAVNRQTKVVSAVYDVNPALPAEQRMETLRALIAQSTSASVRRLVYQRLFRTAMEVSDTAAMIEFGEKYREESSRLYPEQIDAALLARLAIARADQSEDLPRGVAYAREAYDATATFQPWKTPRNTDESWLSFSAKDGENRYQATRALALEARGWTLCQTGHCAEGEPLLRQAVELRRGEKNLMHLSRAMEQLGRATEAAETKAQAESEWLESLKRRMGKNPSKDFEAASVDGGAVRLSSLKGRVVLVNFWATWCSPCVQEMPVLADLYQKYKDRGLEILAISVDEEAARHKVGRFVKEHGLNFPVLYDNGVAELYKVGSYPTSLLIDREGTVRLRFNIAEKRSLDALLGELLR